MLNIVTDENWRSPPLNERYRDFRQLHCVEAPTRENSSCEPKISVKQRHSSNFGK
jgi:hypothetical protein